MTENERYLVIGVEDGWIKVDKKTWKEYLRIKKLEKQQKMV